MYLIVLKYKAPIEDLAESLLNIYARVGRSMKRITTMGQVAA
jgi:hypothetical protein